jgi:Spherulation-specific family 4
MCRSEKAFSSLAFLSLARTDTRQVIHNPGTIPEPGLAAPGPDVTAVVEEGYAKYQSPPVQERLAALSNPHYDWNRSCFIVHSVPATHVRRLVCELRQRGAYIFVTERRRNFYEAFGETWAAFVETMDANA